MKSRAKRILAVLAAFIMISGSVGGAPVSADDGFPGTSTPAAAEFAAGEMVVKFSGAGAAESSVAAYEAAQAAAALKAAGGSLIRTSRNDPRFQLWQVPQGREQEFIQQFSQQRGIEYAEPNSRYAVNVVPNDPNYSSQWAHPKINSPAAWDITTGSTNIVIAIIDTGIDLNHPDLASKLVQGYDYWAYDAVPNDENGHGTHVAGIAGSITNNATGVAGMSWGARIMPVRVLNAEGQGFLFDIIEGILFAKDNGADIINLSLGGQTYNQAMQDAVDQAHAAGSLVIAAMGNDNTSTPAYPAAYSNVMAVSATDSGDARSFYSNFGSHVDIAAPGGEMAFYHDTNGILSTMPTYDVYMTTTYSYYKNYDYLQGTSQATPYVSGLAALVWSLSPSMTNDQVQSVIQSTAVDLGTAGWDTSFGWGRIHASAAAAAVNLQPPPLDPITNGDLDGSYTVNWNDVPDATTYILEEDDSADFPSPTVRYTGAISQFEVVGQEPGLWYYRVKAGNGVIESGWSNYQTAGVAPPAPALAAISNPAPLDVYTVTWGTAAGAIGYELQEANNASFTGAATRYQGSSTHYATTGQAQGTWYYRVRAYNMTGNGPFSGSQSTSVPAAPLAAPDVLAISNPQNIDTYNVNWTAVTGASGYIVEATPDPYFVDTTEVYSGTATSLPVTGQIPGTWGYRVRAISAGGMSAWSVPEFTGVYMKLRLPLIMRQ